MIYILGFYKFKKIVDINKRKNILQIFLSITILEEQ